MSQPFEDTSPAPGPPITELSKGQRRVLGTLLEKAFTTPEAYPLTLKALTTGCNQKSNRHPMTDYSEDDVLEIIDQLREFGLVAVVHTESGRTERYRHYMRKRFTLSEPQLAALTELLLRGRQSVGDLRARASRMVPIESLDDLREALRGLAALNYLQAGAALERRGVEVDHNFYQAGENKRITSQGDADFDRDETAASLSPARSAVARAPVAPTASSTSEPGDEFPPMLRDFQVEQRELQGRVDALEDEVRRLRETLDDLKRQLGG